MAAPNNNARDSLADVELQAAEVAEIKAPGFVVSFDLGVLMFLRWLRILRVTHTFRKRFVETDIVLFCVLHFACLLI